jgi:ornithine carbamoyltransferase
MLAEYSGVPVFNGLTDSDHPTQALADIMTLEENIHKPLNECKLVFCGDTRNNVAYCLMYICSKLGMHYVGCGPKELCPDSGVMERCLAVAEKTGAVIECLTDPYAAVKGADALYTDIWASMGEEHLIPERVRLLTSYRITGELLAAAENPDCIFLHCLPSFHDFNTEMAAEQFRLGYDIREVTDEVFNSPRSKVFDEAENRMHTTKAVLVALIRGQE